MVSVPAFTNAVGIHSKHEVRTERSRGKVFDVASGSMVDLDRVDDSFFQLVAHSRKPAPYIGDHRTAYDYWRGIETVVTDTPYLLHSHYVNPVDGLTSNYDYISNEFISKRHTPFNYDPVYKPGLIDNAWDQAVNTALLSIKGRSAEVGAALGELKPTVEALANTAMRGANFIRHMRRGRWKEAADDLGISLKAFNTNRGKALADYWLAYAYGWRPLAGTMYDIQETFSGAVQRISNIVEGTGSAKVGESHRFVYGNWNVEGDWDCGCRAVFKATLTNPKVALLNSIGLTNPVSVAWELVPFSFVVDWFMPVGNTLEAMTAGHGLEWLGGWITKRILKKVGIRHKTGYITPWVNCVDGGSYLEKRFEFSRTAVAGFPYGRFYVDLTPYSTPRAVNALALVRQLT